MCHPTNPGFPQPWILRAKGSMQNAVYPYPGAEAVPLTELKLRYRLIVHDEGAQQIEISKLYDDYRRTIK